MFERFTEKAIKVVMISQEESRRLNHNFVGTEQMLIGLLGEGTGVAARILKQEGLVISDITSGVFVYDIPWIKIDVSVFSWQKALGGEAQHGMVVLSPKAKNRLKKKKSIPKVLDIARHDYLINTPSLLSFADLEICLDAYVMRGSLEGNKKICEENKKIIIFQAY